MVNIENSRTVHQIGAGGFGKIFLCEDDEGNQFVSKQITSDNSFYNELICYKELLKHTDYFPKFYNYFTSDLKKCIFLENCQEDLRNILDNKEEICEESFIFHIAQGLSILKKKRIIHCDIKPENILYDSRSDLFKICDFGISCYADGKKGFPVQTTYYRSPEVIFRKEYDFSIDIWSFGCIIYEIIYGNIFLQYKDEEVCFVKMIEKLGMPPEKIYKHFYEHNLQYIDGIPVLKNCKSISDMCINIDKIEFGNTREEEIMEMCLEWHPIKRITPEDIIRMYE